jgi:acyl carrier protein
MSEKEKEITSFLVRWLTEQLKRPITANSHFAKLGIDSLDVVRMTDALAEHLGLDELSVELVMDHPSVEALATHVATLKKG